MRLTDIVALSLSSLRQQKARTVLTTLGVVFGSLVLAASLAAGQGVQRTVRSLARASDSLRHVQVYPDWRGRTARSEAPGAEVAGVMSDARRERLGRALAERKARLAGRPPEILSEEKLGALGAIEHLELMVPLPWLSGHAVLNGRAEAVQIDAVRPGDAALAKRVVAGRLFTEPDEPAVVVSELLLHLLGFTDEASAESVIGQTLRIEFRPRRGQGLSFAIRSADGGEANREEAALVERLTALLPALLERLELSPTERALLQRVVSTQPAPGLLHGEEFTIVGIVRAPGPAEEERWNPFDADADVLMPFETASNLYFRIPGLAERGVNRAVLVADSEDHVEQVVEQAKALGFEAFAPLQYLKRQRLIYLLIFGGMTCVAVTALVVAALGIANTMLISVLERTREIGIMKAVGADSRDLQLVFLFEGAIIGLVGGTLGVLLAWVASFPGDAWIRSVASRSLEVELRESIFHFPVWLVAGVVLLAVVVTVLAAVYPSRRAAGVDPVTALRHE